MKRLDWNRDGMQVARRLESARVPRGVWWIGFVLCFCMRGVLLLGFIEAGRLVSYGLGIIEFCALVLGIVNAFGGKWYDSRPIGLFNPFAYTLGVWLVPRYAVSSWLTVGLVIVGLSLNTWALICLGKRFSIAGSAWHSLVDRGPYRFVRHPQLLARLVLLCAVACGTYGVVDFVRVLVAMCLTLTVLRVEESGLLWTAASIKYAEYAQRVKWRLVPGLY